MLLLVLTLAVFMPVSANAAPKINQWVNKGRYRYYYNQKGKKVKNINDFERLVKLDMLLMGEATERVERGGTQELSQDAKDRLDEIAQLMKSAKK